MNSASQGACTSSSEGSDLCSISWELFWSADFMSSLHSLFSLLRIRKTHLCCLPLFDLSRQTFNCHHVLRTVLWLQRPMVWLILILRTQYSVLGKLWRVFNQMLWVKSCGFMQTYVLKQGFHTVWMHGRPYSLLCLVWTVKSGPDLSVCTMLRAGGGHQQNSEWEPAYPLPWWIMKLYLTADNRLTVSLLSDAARWSMHLSSYQQGGWIYLKIIEMPSLKVSCAFWSLLCPV